jgi:hypothetical protein
LLELLHQLKDDFGSGVEETMLRRDQRRKQAAKKEAARAAAIMLKDRSVKKLELKEKQGDGYDGSSSDVDNPKLKKTKTGGIGVHSNIQMLIDMGKEKGAARIDTAQQRVMHKNAFFQWKKDQADRDEKHRDKEIEVRKMEAANRKLELELQIAVMKEKNNNNDK